MSLTQYLLFCILLLLGLGAVIAFAYCVIKPLQTRWAIGQARRTLETGKAKSKWQFINVYRILATARGDLEAAALWQKLDGMKEQVMAPEGKKIYVGIVVPPEHKTTENAKTVSSVRN